MRERSQGVLPERVDQRTQFGQACRVQAEEVMGAPAVFVHQARGFQDLQMLRDRGPAYRKAAGQFADGQRAAPQQVQHGLARGIGESRQHRLMVSHDLR